MLMIIINSSVIIIQPTQPKIEKLRDKYRITMNEGEGCLKVIFNCLNEIERISLKTWREDLEVKRKKEN